MTSKLFKYGSELDQRNIRKADSYEELIDKMKRRISGKYSPTKVKWIWQIQAAFESVEVDILLDGTAQLNYYELFNLLRFTINKKAEWLERKYRAVRLSFHDFEAELWKITYAAIEYYEQAGDIDTEFTLLETLEMYWKTRMIDFIRGCLYTKKRGPWYTADSLT